MRRFSKRGQIGDMIELIPRILVLAVVAVVIFGVASVFYGFNISVRDAEARIIGVKMAECLTGNSIINLDKIGEENYNKIFSYCDFLPSERVYLGLEVFDSADQRVASLHEGDSGLLWVKELFLTANAVSGINSESVKEIIEYNPGYYAFEYPVFVVYNGWKFEGRVEMEVLVNNEK